MEFMKTLIEKIDKMNPDEQVLEKAGKILKQGGLVAFPTEPMHLMRMLQGKLMKQKVVHPTIH